MNTLVGLLISSVILGGWHASTENTNKVECLDIYKNQWEFKAEMIERRYRPGEENTSILNH